MKENVADPPKAEEIGELFQLTRDLLLQLLNLKSEFDHFRFGHNHEEFGKIPPGNPASLEHSLSDLDGLIESHVDRMRRLSTVVELANIQHLKVTNYESTALGVCASITATESILRLARLAWLAIARLLFGNAVEVFPTDFDSFDPNPWVIFDFGEKHIIPEANSDAFVRECSECEKLLRDVSEAEIGRLEAEIRIEELRTLDWLRLNNTIPEKAGRIQSPSDDTSPKKQTPVSFPDMSQVAGTSQKTNRVLVSITQIANTVGNEPGSMTPYVKEWGSCVVIKRGRIEGKWDFAAILPKLRKQFPHVTDNDWKDLETTARTT